MKLTPAALAVAALAVAAVGAQAIGTLVRHGPPLFAPPGASGPPGRGAPPSSARRPSRPREAGAGRSVSPSDVSLRVGFTLPSIQRTGGLTPPPTLTATPDPAPPSLWETMQAAP